MNFLYPEIFLCFQACFLIQEIQLSFRNVKEISVDNNSAIKKGHLLANINVTVLDDDPHCS